MTPQSNVQKAPAGTSLVDVLDRVLDKGIVIDAYVRVSLVGIDLVSVEARVVVASVETYLEYADSFGVVGMISRPSLGSTTDGDSLRLENQRLRQEIAALRGEREPHEVERGTEP